MFPALYSNELSWSFLILIITHLQISPDADGHPEAFVIFTPILVENRTDILAPYFCT